ncbi:hypothetical protein QNI19_29755 [Cytophagaceae bacterium DM2B3-1]|uniref:Lipoprotein n=1 Tax=Xanthocytophaga flava TaxID=3048013 RepID=A0ABT7CTR3_9BACT|nr:hypothetical protein [Xanthocytophaga flavus]MDJ1497161.1 hypothetical protein [Xanthocytophaga flavus]
MKLVLLSLLILLLWSCDSTQEESIAESSKGSEIQLQKKSGEEKESFDAYLKNFKKVSLPINIKACEPNIEDLITFDNKEFEAYRANKSFSPDAVIAFRQIPVNGNYVAVISLGYADCLLPILTTYRKNGVKIDEKTIAIGYCGSDCGYSCEEFMTLQNDFSIYTSDTVTSSDCDSLGNIVPGTTEKYVIYRKGRLLSNGKIELSNEIKELLSVKH